MMHSMCRVIWLIKLITLIHFTSSVSTVETRISFVTVETRTMTLPSFRIEKKRWLQLYQ